MASMEETVIGLDVGASLTKIVLVDEGLRIIGYRILPSSDLRGSVLKALNHLLKNDDSAYESEARIILATGGGSRFLSDKMFKIPFRRIDEIVAIGLGGSTISGKSDCLVVSAGTGTALVVVRDGGRIIKHVGGTGVGGGTIIGLSQRLIGIHDFRILEEMALRGDPGKVDITVSDIIGGPIGILPANATASNFGKISDDTRSEDIVAGIFNLVSQTIAGFAAVAAKAYSLEDSVIVTGMLAKSKIISRIMRETASLFSVDISIPENCDLAGAIGAVAAHLRGVMKC